MAEKEALNSEAEICGTVTLGYERPGLLNPELPHAAATTAKLATAAQAAFLVASCKKTTRLFPGRIPATVFRGRPASTAGVPLRRDREVRSQRRHEHPKPPRNFRLRGHACLRRDCRETSLAGGSIGLDACPGCRRAIVLG